MKKIIRYSTLLALISFVFAGSVLAQDPVSKSDLEGVLSRFSNYRYGTVSIWKFKNEDRDKIRETLKEYQIAESGEAEVSSEILANVDPRIISKTEECVLGGTPNENCYEDIEMSFTDITLPSWDEYVNIYEAIRKSKFEVDSRVIRTAYLVTTRGTTDYRGTIIAIIVSTQDDVIGVNLEGPNNKDIYIPEELKLITMTDMDEPMLTNLYDLAERRLAQGNLENKTLEAQGIGNTNWFGQKNFGKTTSLFQNEYDLTSEDIQSVKRISDIQPIDYFFKENEIIASPDLVSWRSYEMPFYENDNGEMVPDSFFAVNSRLPKLGLELKYGIDEINYYSMWSERMTFSALWDNVKLGVILPTNGWSSITDDVFSVERKLTHAGFGIAGEFDFPIKIIPKSGVFHLGFGYVFGDANECGYKDRNLNVDEFVQDNSDYDYLIRLNAQLHYTFAMQIDNDYYFRFGIGATVYTTEKWLNTLETPEDKDPFINYAKDKSETVGGISGKLEFMTKNISTPYGASVQYFDEGLGVNAWLQIPIIQNTFALRLDAKGYFKAFKDNPRAWEKKSVFIPMARFIVNF
ncbi:MAG: hypothetical protein PHV24_07090 [Candidatus Kapabacteria bacterium]|nr:hypothetical protein [Candidatus Kapabacteria bacterium]